MPGVPIPYHVFEPRYQALIRDLKSLPDGRRWLAIPQLRAGLDDENPGQPGFHPVATVGRVVDMLPVGGGRFDILVEGLYRCSLDEVHSPNPYRMAKPTMIPDLDAHVFDVDGAKRPLCFKPLEQGILSLVAMVGEQAGHLLSMLASGAKPSIVLYRLGATLLHDPKRRQAFLEVDSIAGRSEYLVNTLAGLLVVADRHRRKGSSGGHS